MESSPQGERNLVPLPALYKKQKEDENTFSCTLNKKRQNIEKNA